MSSFFSEKYAALIPYTPGEQPRGRKYIKLNTNESPFPPSPHAQEYARAAAGGLELYSDPESTDLRRALAASHRVAMDEVVAVNGSDEILNFAFMAFCDAKNPAVFADITYGFYSVFAQVNFIPTRVIPLSEDFNIRPDDYKNAGGTVFLANPNAPTGIALSRAEVEEIVRANPDHVVVVDEAYVDFGGESCVPLIHKYNNLLVTQTFSKSRSLAGGRLGMGFACRELIADINTVRYSTNPYNVNRMTAAAGIGALEDEEYMRENCRTIIENRAWTAAELQKLGFTVLPSATNFLFAAHPDCGGAALYTALKERGILVRHFEKPRLSAFNRITVGTRAQMEALVAALTEILNRGN